MEIRRFLKGKRVGGGLIGSASGWGEKGELVGAPQAFSRCSLGVTAGVVVGPTVGDDDGVADVDGGRSGEAVSPRL